MPEGVILIGAWHGSERKVMSHAQAAVASSFGRTLLREGFRKRKRATWSVYMAKGEGKKTPTSSVRQLGLNHASHDTLPLDTEPLDTEPLDTELVRASNQKPPHNSTTHASTPSCTI